MAMNEVILQGARAGIEAVRATCDTVDYKIYEKIELNESAEPLEFEEATGTYDAWHSWVLGPVTVDGTVEGPATYEDFAWWMQLGVKGGVVGASDTYTFAPSPSTDDLASATFESNVPDNVYQSCMVMLPEWSVAADIDGDAAWAFNGSLLARTLAPKPAGYTAGVLDHAREFIRAAGTKVYIDDEGGTLGATLQTGRAISFEVNWNNAIQPKRFFEDVAGISARIGRGGREITGQITLEFDTDDEMAHYRAGDRRRLRFEREGSLIGGAVNKRVRIDIPNARWMPPEKGARETNLIATYGFRALFDDVAGWPASVQVITDDGY